MRQRHGLILVDDLLARDAARAASGDEAHLLTSGIDAAGGRGVTNVLVVATTVGVLDRIHRHTAGPRPLVVWKRGGGDEAL